MTLIKIMGMKHREIESIEHPTPMSHTTTDSEESVLTPSDPPVQQNPYTIRERNPKIN